MKRQNLSLLLLGSIFAMPIVGKAQQTPTEKNIDEVVIVGSRVGGRSNVESPVPVDVFDLKKSGVQLPQTNINQILNTIAPSFTSTVQVAADGTDHLDPAQLRGLGPDQTLVLLNGKRRHTSAFINVNGTPGRGTVGTDLNAIPSFALTKIEVLRDGASAQYGSDAIAGVLNLQLKRDRGFTAQLSYGGNLTSTAKDHTGIYDGQQGQLDLNYGLDLGKKGGFVNLTFSGQFREPTYRAGVFNGTIYNTYNAIEQRALEDGINLSSYFDNIKTISNPNAFIGLIQKYAQQVGYLDASLQTQIQSATSISQLQNLLKGDVSDKELEYRGLDRRDFNMKIGQSKMYSLQSFINTEIPISDDWKVYAFGGHTFRSGNAGGFYRRPNQSRTFTGYYANGFLPEIATDIEDTSLSAGIKGKLGEWSIDLSNTFGQNTFAYIIKNTSNTSLRFKSPSEFDAGSLRFVQNTINLDFSRPIRLFYKSNLSFGAEQRHEVFQIKAGEEASYAVYDIYGNVQTGETVSMNKPTDFFGNNLPGGAQVFSGFRAETALKKHRNVYALYGEFETDITPWLLANAAVRFENYSDFGNTTNYKLATRVKITKDLNFRAAASTGFRAPSIHQIYYTNTGTLYLNGNLIETGTFNNESQVAKLFGIDKLREEKSKSISTGITYRIPKARLSFTLDAYFIRVDDRIVLTETFSRPSSASTPSAISLQQLFDQANVSAAQFFANAVNAQTRGVDFVASHTLKLGKAILNNDFGINLTQTKQVGGVKVPEIVKLNGLENSFFSERARVYLESAVPRVKASLSHNLTVGKYGVYLRNTLYGKTTSPAIVSVANRTAGFDFDALGHQVNGARIVTDLSGSYDFNEHLKLTLGVNNLFDIFPERNVVSESNNDQFVYSRSTSQFGQNGRYVFARLNFNF